jgi:hypothetical protein
MATDREENPLVKRRGLGPRKGKMGKGGGGEKP